jgi:predicted lipoprotein with Yx(FWY)xxD motif
MRARFVLLGAALTIGLAACGGGSGSDKAAKPAANAGAGQAAAGSASVKVSTSSLGSILTDQSGRTLYAFTNDKGGTSSCTAGCIATWPALASKKKVTAAAGVNPALLKETKRAEGTSQATYGDWPLYYYVGDMGPGDVDGQGVDGVWFVVGADGKLIKTGR